MRILTGICHLGDAFAAVEVTDGAVVVFLEDGVRGPVCVAFADIVAGVVVVNLSQSGTGKDWPGRYRTRVIDRRSAPARFVCRVIDQFLNVRVQHTISDVTVQQLPSVVEQPGRAAFDAVLLRHRVVRRQRTVCLP